MMHIMVFVKF